jgi:hypothetical protein
MIMSMVSSLRGDNGGPKVSTTYLEDIDDEPPWGSDLRP